ncbi:MAG: DUF2344 domain-containing protein [Clostridia bacterium]|nr:DUF2344 domain-containing protein [Clostridia bacterium]
MVSEEKQIIPVRIKFSKTGDLMYISHLDLARTMQRIILRSGLDIWYSEGFNPQPKMVFALPLPTGVESECELMDIKINSYMPNEEIMDRLSRNFPPNMKVLAVYQPEQKFKNIAFAKYKIDLYSPKISEKASNDILELFSGECLIEKKTKSGVKEINICDYIKEISTQNGENSISIEAVLSADNEKNLNPELLVEAIRRNLGIMNTEGTEEYYKILRQSLLTDELKEFN